MALELGVAAYFADEFAEDVARVWVVTRFKFSLREPPLTVSAIAAGNSKVRRRPPNGPNRARAHLRFKASDAPSTDASRALARSRSISEVGCTHGLPIGSYTRSPCLPHPQPPPRYRLRVVQVGFVSALAFAWIRSHTPPEDAVDEVTGSKGMGGLAFEEVAERSGIHFRHRTPRLDPKLEHIHPQIAGTGASIATVDVDGDGWLDLYTTTMASGELNALFRNRGDGTFEDIAASVGLADLNRDGQGASHGSIWGDVDRDGDLDVLVYKWGRSQLLLQDSDGHFEDVTRAAGLDHWMNCAAAIWFDYDRDGWLDLVMGGYYHEGTNLWATDSTRVLHEDSEFAHNGGKNYLFRNLGDARFEDVGDELGIGGDRWTYGLGAADFDRDGWHDLYVANDYGAEELFLNRGGERFELLEGAGLDTKSKSGMCVSIGDVTNRGSLSVFVTNISEARWLFQGNNLRINRLPESPRFLNLAEAGHGAQDCGWAWGADFGDVDNDGDQDLVVVNGFRSADPKRSYWYQMDKVGGATGRLIEDAKNWPPFEDMSLSGFQRSRLLLNRSFGRSMIDVAKRVGIDDTLDGRAVVLADLYNDGTLDMVVANQEGPLLVYRNALPPDPERWIGYRLTGTVSDSGAVGAEVVAHFGDAVQMQVVTAGSGFCSQTDPRIHFGLGEAGPPSRVTIRWPSGSEQDLPAASLEPGRYHEVLEPKR